MTLPLSMPEYLVTASNTGHGSDNKIHDNAVAKRFGKTILEIQVLMSKISCKKMTVNNNDKILDAH